MLKQLVTILKLIDNKPQITTENVLGELKNTLQREKPEIYDKWKTENFSVDFEFPDKVTLLHAAAEAGQQNTAKALLNANANVNATDNFKLTPLHYAARNGEIHILQLLIQKGADVNAGDEMNETALHKCVQKAPFDEFEDITLLDGTTKSFCMETAITITLIQNGAHVDAISELQNTPLLLAVRFSHADTVQALLERGASVTAVDHYGNNALILAVQEARLDAVPYLLQYGADINVLGKPENQPPLYYAVQNNHVEMVQYLVEKGAKVKLEGSKNSLKHYVTEHTFQDIINCLSENEK